MVMPILISGGKMLAWGWGGVVLGTCLAYKPGDNPLGAGNTDWVSDFDYSSPLITFPPCLHLGVNSNESDLLISPHLPAHWAQMPPLCGISILRSSPRHWAVGADRLCGWLWLIIRWPRLLCAWCYTVSATCHPSTHPPFLSLKDFKKLW